MDEIRIINQMNPEGQALVADKNTAINLLRSHADELEELIWQLFFELRNQPGDAAREKVEMLIQSWRKAA